MSTRADRRDQLIEFIKGELFHGFALGMPETYASIMARLERLVQDHREIQAKTPDDFQPQSRLKQLVPSVSRFHTDLPLEEAWCRYDAKYCVSQRAHVPPSFNEVRHTLNLAQVMAIAEKLQMICFDGDNTLYTDGGNFSNVPLAATICLLMENDVKVVLITAAGYGWDGPAYETRVRGLLDLFMSNGLPEHVMGRFYVLGGECNYLLRCNGSGRLVRVPDEEWQGPSLRGPKPRLWSEEACKHLLDVAEESFRSSIEDLKLRARLIRKPRGIGIIPGGEAAVKAKPQGHGSDKLKAEALDEVVLRVQAALRAAGVAAPRPAMPPLGVPPSPAALSPPLSPTSGGAPPPHVEPSEVGSGGGEAPGTHEEEALPWCAFNGGRDAWVDVGNKSVGVAAMQAFLGVEPNGSLHVGDQFLKTGNDVAARECSPCIWIVSPKETLKVLEILLGLMGLTALSAEGSGSEPSGGGAGGGGSGGSGGGGGGGAAAALPESSSPPPPPPSPLRIGRSISGRAIQGYTYALPELAVPTPSRPGSPQKSQVASPRVVGAHPPSLAIGALSLEAERPPGA